MGRILRYLFALLVLAGLGLGGGFVYIQTAFVKPSDLALDRTIVIPRGAGVERISQILSNDGLLDDPMIFTWGIRLDKLMRKDGGFLQAGEFLIPAKSSPRDIADILRAGVTVVRKITIAEGLTTAEILGLLRGADGLTGNLPLGIAEGTLLPETYHFSYGDSRAALVQRMQTAMKETLRDLWPNRVKGLPLETAYEAVILASVIEKETGVAEERARVSGVFINRLNKGMRLQSDPTVVYGITEGSGPLGRLLTRKDLEKETPFNTYRIKGLPPTPIANPGRAAIEAALNPMKTDELYFVADGEGGHSFAKTLREHNRNVRAYRKTLGR